jgi:hypothetical protein
MTVVSRITMRCRGCDHGENPEGNTERPAVGVAQLTGNLA